MNNSLILRRRGFQAFQGWQFWFQVLVVLILFASVATIFYISKDKYLYTKSFVYMPVAYAAFLFFYSPFMRKSKLEVDDFGLSHVSEVPSIFKRFFPDWRISWSEIESVKTSKNYVLKQSVILPLDLKILSRTIKVIPFQWVDPSKEAKKTWLSRLNKQAQKFEDNALVKVFEAKGLLDANVSKTLGKPQSTGSDLNSNPISIGMMFFLFFALFYFITEVYFTLSEFYVGSPPYAYMIIGAIVAVIVSYLLLIKTNFASAEKIILALLMGGSMAAMMYPLMLRVNEWTDTEGLQTYSYTKSDMVRWTSDIQNNQIPSSLKFNLASSKYWAQFEIGDTKKFELRKGGLGFYQLNMEPIYAEQREFYRDK